ncbi:MAG TPA: DUF6580 family putative transport protein [Chthoniobacteraceae bacterium]|jgi:hypothetical protein|nr:DUF6580 family putative transport protein [Chthoniobacteraceae bacterium]
MIAAAVLVLVVVAYRVVMGVTGSGQMDAWHNFSPLAAVALCGAIYFPKRVALAFPLLALFVSDLILNAHYAAPLLSWDILPRYAALGLTAGFGWLLRDNARPGLVLAASAAGSTAFFLITNTGAWLGEPRYGGDLVGWTQAMTTGLPGYPSTLLFFRNTLLSDLSFSALFLICVAFPSKTKSPLQAPRTQQLTPW